MLPSIPDSAALLLLDMQNDFLLPHGALPVLDGEAIIPVVQHLRTRFRDSHCIYTQDWHPKNHISFSSQHPGAPVLSTIELPHWRQLIVPDHAVQNSWGAQFHEAVVPQPTSPVIRKGTDASIESHSAFYDVLGDCTGLYPLLQAMHVDRLVICGVHTDVLLSKTVKDALKLYPAPGTVTVVSDAVAGFVAERCTSCVTEMKSAGVIFCLASEV